MAEDGTSLRRVGKASDGEYLDVVLYIGVRDSGMWKRIAEDLIGNLGNGVKGLVRRRRKHQRHNR